MFLLNNLAHKELSDWSDLIVIDIKKNKLSFQKGC